MKKLEAQEALSNVKHNKFKYWSRPESSLHQSSNPSDASCRIHNEFATIKPTYSGTLFKKDAAVFAMGSCFAREIEAALILQGGNVISVNENIQIDEFRDGNGEIRNGFFHRFTPRAMWQEFMCCFDQLENWQPQALIIGEGNEKLDMNYWQIKTADSSLETILTRRKVAKDLVKNAAKADIIILTLGLVEAWFHKPSQLYVNRVTVEVLRKYKDEFELHLLDVSDTLECLEQIYSLLHEKHETGNFRFVVTVSPVPLQTTFTNDDIIIANSTSKAILRAAAAEFVNRYQNVDYFPSYEMVNYSARELAWRPDLVHVHPNMVSHIVNTFCKTYYE